MLRACANLQLLTRISLFLMQDIRWKTIGLKQGAYCNNTGPTATMTCHHSSYLHTATSRCSFLYYNISSLTFCLHNGLFSLRFVSILRLGATSLRCSPLYIGFCLFLHTSHSLLSALVFFFFFPSVMVSTCLSFAFLVAETHNRNLTNSKANQVEREKRGGREGYRGGGEEEERTKGE